MLVDYKPIVSSQTMVAVLLYGNYHALHKRILLSFSAHMPKDVRLVVWCNQVCDETKTFLPSITSQFANHLITYSDENVPKYKAMRLMLKDLNPAQYTWFNWWDDDSYIVSHDWLDKTAGFVRERPKDNVCCVGKVFYMHRRDGMGEFIEQSPWYKGKPPILYPNRSKQKVPAARFATGGYWWLRTDVLKDLDWPDVRLSHNGGDTLLGEALHQVGYPLHNFAHGVKINQSPRRGLHEKRAGAK